MHISFTRFNKSNIDIKIKLARLVEANQIVKATNIPLEMNRQMLTTIFTKYERIKRLAIVKRELYNIVYVIYELPTSTIIFNNT